MGEPVQAVEVPDPGLWEACRVRVRFVDGRDGEDGGEVEGTVQQMDGAGISITVGDDETLGNGELYFYPWARIVFVKDIT